MTRIAVGIANARIAGAVRELLAGEERYVVEKASRAAAADGGALAVVDAGFLVRSSERFTLPAVVLVRSDVEREAVAHRASDVREWLRTSATGDDLLAAVARAVATLPPVAEAAAATEVVPSPAPIDVGPDDAEWAVAGIPLGLLPTAALSALSVILVAAIGSVLWAALG